ncbi:MAG: hypothetical protein RL077_2719 [Verrucomicrobiota bacterium]|jgi:TonB-dependent receptor
MQPNTLNHRPHRTYTAIAICGWLLFFHAALWAQSIGTGVIEGRILNTSSGTYLNNARISVKGTAIETTSNQSGEYRLSNLPSGDAVLSVSYVGLAPQTTTVAVQAGKTVNRDFSLNVGRPASGAPGEVVTLEAFTVEERQLSGQAVALQEQRTAPNIKNVLSLSEFGDMGEGNVGEYIKFIPGLDLAYNPTNPTTVAIRGMPASGTLIMSDGAVIASPGFGMSRSTDLSNASSANVDRIEITKTPTPDMPANAVGGSVNMITKSGFSRTRPLFSYNVFMAYNDSGGIEDPVLRLDKLKGPDGKSSFARIQPAANLNYIWPVNKSLALTFTANYAPRFGTFEYQNVGWDRVRNVQTSNVTNVILSGIVTKMFSTSVDWRVAKDDLIRISYQNSDVYKMIRQNQFQRNPGSTATGGSTFTQGASTGIGSIGQVYDSNSQYLKMGLATLSYRHEGPEWKWAASLSYSKGDYVTRNTADGFFTAVATTNAINGNLILRLDGLDGIYDRKVPKTTAVTREGVPVDIYSASSRSITSASTTEPNNDQKIINLAAHVTRSLQLAMPVTLKAGWALDQQKRKDSSNNFSYTFNPPGGAAAREVRNYDVVATEFSRDWYSTDITGGHEHPEFLSMTKVYNLYKQHPDWWTVNEAAAYQSQVQNRRRLEETVTAAFLRADARFLEKRLWLVGGVRFEHTADKGQGVLNDISATFLRNANGTFARDSAGNKIPVTTDALARTKLQYKLFGTTAESSYRGYYPSVNASYSIKDDIVLRAAYARTIGRPNIGSIVPGTSITDPDSTGATRTITVVNTGLRPWTSDNFDVTAEAYNIKGAVATVSLFQKDLTGFFTGTRSAATEALVESYGVPWEDYYSAYEVVTTRNGGTARLRGIELSYRQSLLFLPAWAKGFQVFTNVTAMSLSGPDRANLQSFAPRNVNWGVSYSRSKFSANVNVALQKWIRQGLIAASATVPEGTYQYQKNSPRVDTSFEYNFTKRLGIYGGVRNLLAVPNARIQTNKSVPSYTLPNQYQYNFALVTLGIKGTF